MALANWQPQAERTAEVPFVVARVPLQDFTGVPLLVDLAAMRSEVERMGRPPSLIAPLAPVDSKRPQDRVTLPNLQSTFAELFSRPASGGGFGRSAEKLNQRFPTRLGVCSRRAWFKGESGSQNFVGARLTRGH